MFKNRYEQASENFESALVNGIAEFGPRDIRRLSALLRVPYGRAISSYRRMKMRLGLQVCAAPNTDLLGLRHVFFKATPDPKHRRVALHALKSLRCLNYLAVDADRPSELFGLLYVPVGERGERYLEVFDLLVERGFLECYSTRIFPEIARYSVRPEYVDWCSGRYVFDWGALAPRPVEPKTHDVAVRPQADLIDILLLEELEQDAAKSFPQISRRLKETQGVAVSDRLLLYHYEKHLVARKLFSKYRVAFSQTGKLGVYVLSQMGSATLEEYSELVRRIPYLSRELSDRSGQHFFECYVPSADYQGFLDYVQARLSPLARRIECYVSLPNSRSAFTLPSELFDEESGEWTHDPHRDAEAVLQKTRLLEQQTQ